MSCNVAIGSIVGVAAVVESVTIFIAIGSCIYLNWRNKKSRQTSLAKQKADQRASKAYSHHNFDGEDDDDGSKTIRVVHNSLYQSMKSDDGGRMSPVEPELERSRNISTIPESRLEQELQLSKPLSTTQGSSHTYEPVHLAASSLDSAQFTPGTDEVTRDM